MKRNWSHLTFCSVLLTLSTSSLAASSLKQRWLDQIKNQFPYHSEDPILKHVEGPEHGVLPNRPMEGMFTKVIDTYGDLYVKEGKLSAEAKTKPWSSWWYPLREDTLWKNKEKASTLYRYDKIVERWTGENPGAQDYEIKNIYDPQSVGWAGHCSAWAMASILSPEPKTALDFRGILFRVQDLKALLIKTYDYTDGVEQFGQRNDGKWDSVYEDIYPEQFHRFIQEELFNQKKVFIIDHDASYEVWNVPVFKGQTRVTKDENNPNVVHVKTWLYTVSPFVDDKNFVGTKTTVRTYTYDLYGKWSRGKFKVKFGKWTDSSRWDHPDYMIPKPADDVKHYSFNKQIKNNIVDYIIKDSFSEE